MPKIIIGDTIRDATKAELAALDASRVVVEPTPEEKDAKAAQVATAVLERSPQTTALGLVVRDLAQAALGMDRATATAEVKRRFEMYYRDLL